MTQQSPYEMSALRTTRRRLFGATALAAAPLTVPGLAPRKAHAADPSVPGTVVVQGNQAQAVVVLPPGYEPTRDVAPIEMEVETGEVVAPMEIVEDDTVSGGAYVHAPGGTPAGKGSVTVSFEVETSAVYEFELMSGVPDGSADSFTFRIDSGALGTWHMGYATTGWQWRTLTDRPASVDVPIALRLEAGTHQIQFITREARAQLARIRVVPVRTTTQLNHSADQLVEYVEKSTGVRLPLASADDDLSDLPKGRIHVGWTGPDGDETAEQAAAGLDVDGFVLSSRDGVISILGGSEWGIRYGVYELLEREVGVAWLLPGPDGDDVPVRDEWTVPNQLDIQEPSFRSRTMPYIFDTNEPNAKDWASDDPQVIWATRQRTHSRITNGGNHNLFNVFPPSVYADPTKPTYRPEIFPIIDGQVKIPAPNSGGYGGWQPRFDIELTVDIAVAYIRDYFERNPDGPLLSLAVNDRAGYSETDFEGDLLNSIGHRSASRSYYAWVNKVVTRALEGHPELTDKIFPVLAYDSVIDPPEFDIHPNVVPMITKEAHAWADRGGVGRAHFSGLLDDWGERATTLALYDYCSGHRYVVPRMITPVLQEAYRYGYSKGMRYSYADMTPAPVGEGPKTWTYGKMIPMVLNTVGIEFVKAASAPLREANRRKLRAVAASQVDVARLAGVSPSAVSAVLRERKGLPDC